MKSKPTKRPDPEIEQEDEDLEIESGGPEIASGKKSKVMVIAASALLTVLVIYFFFIKQDNSKENLERVETPQVVNVSPSDTGKSPFEIEAPKEDTSKADVDILAQPSTPELPKLPELPKDAIVPDKIDLTVDQKKNEPLLPNQIQPLLPEQQQQNLPQQAQNKPGQADQGKDTKDQKTDPRYAPIVIFSGAVDGAPARGVGYDNNIVSLNKDPINSLQATTTSITPTRIADLEHTIAQGKLLVAVLETAINTELPGSVRAIVSRDVYGEAGNDVLIPKGSRLYGSYSSKINKGQARVEIGWTRLIRPDGVDMAISFNASDQFGRSGLPGDVDNKYDSVIADSLLTSVLAVGGVAAAQNLLGNNTTTVTTNPTQGSTTTTGNASNQALYDMSKTIIDTVGQVISNAIDITPVIRVPQGTRITVVVNSDITIPAMRK